MRQLMDADILEQFRLDQEQFRAEHDDTGLFVATPPAAHGEAHANPRTALIEPALGEIIQFLFQDRQLIFHQKIQKCLLRLSGIPGADGITNDQFLSDLFDRVSI